jgi:drug/metabolite transporter (DMT)-like permease
LEKGIFIALIAALLMGATNFLVGASARQLAPVISIWSAWLFTGLVGLLIIFRREGVKKFTSNVIKHKWLVIATVIFDTFAWLFYAFAISQREIGIITAITESYVVIGVSLGLIFNKEKIAPHQIFGCVLAIGASILLALSIV